MTATERHPLSSRLSAAIAGRDPGGLLYGAIVTGAVLVTVGGHDATVGHVLAVWAVVLGTYWLTHIYVDALEREFDGDHRNLLRRSISSAGSEAPVLLGGLPAMGVFVLVSRFGFDALSAEKVALWCTVALLAMVGYLGARHTGRARLAAATEAFGASLLGLVMVAAKTLLH